MWVLRSSRLLKEARSLRGCCTCRYVTERVVERWTAYNLSSSRPTTLWSEFTEFHDLRPICFAPALKNELNIHVSSNSLYSTCSVPSRPLITPVDTSPSFTLSKVKARSKATAIVLFGWVVSLWWKLLNCVWQKLALPIETRFQHPMYHEHSTWCSRSFLASRWTPARK